MNGNTIYGTYKTDGVASYPEPYAKNGSVEAYLLGNLSKELDKLPDGSYELEVDNIIVDVNGKIVFYDYLGIDNWSSQKAPDDVKKEIAAKIDQLLNNIPALQPGKIDERAVLAVVNTELSRYKIQVKDHKSAVRKT